MIFSKIYSTKFFRSFYNPTTSANGIGWPPDKNTCSEFLVLSSTGPPQIFFLRILLISKKEQRLKGPKRRWQARSHLMEQYSVKKKKFHVFLSVTPYFLIHPNETSYMGRAVIHAHLPLGPSLMIRPPSSTFDPFWIVVFKYRLKFNVSV